MQNPSSNIQEYCNVIQCMNKTNEIKVEKNIKQKEQNN